MPHRMIGDIALDATQPGKRHAGKGPDHRSVMRADSAGYELAHQAIKFRLNLRVLSTNVNNFIDKVKATSVDGVHFLQKPYAQHQPQNAVKALLAA